MMGVLTESNALVLINRLSTRLELSWICAWENTEFPQASSGFTNAQKLDLQDAMREVRIRKSGFNRTRAYCAANNANTRAADISCLGPSTNGPYTAALIISLFCSEGCPNCLPPNANVCGEPTVDFRHINEYSLDHISHKLAVK